MDNLYDTDVVTWAEQQAAFLRRGEWASLDVANLVEEIEDVAESEQRELQRRMSGLLSSLLKWQRQPGLRCQSRSVIIALQRSSIGRELRTTPSLQRLLAEQEWLELAWCDALIQVIGETGMCDLPGDPIWTITDILDPAFLPD